MAQTPGPWVLCHDGEVNDVDMATVEYRWPWQIVGADDTVVVDFTGGSDVSDEDALLMRSAPELLDALQMTICRYCDNRIGFDPDPANSPYPKPCQQGGCRPARDVIAKAKGESRS